MQDQPEALSGPELLDAVADTECGDGRTINGHTYRRLAAEWREDKRAVEAAAQAVADLQHRLDRATRALAA